MSSHYLQLLLFVPTEDLGQDRVRRMVDLLLARGFRYEPRQPSWRVTDGYQERVVSLDEVLVDQPAARDWGIRLLTDVQADDQQETLEVTVTISRTEREAPFAMVGLSAAFYYSPIKSAIEASFVEWALWLTEELHPWYGCAGGDETIWTDQSSTDGRRIAGLELLRLEWLNVYGPRYVAALGREKLLAAASSQVHELTEGTIVVAAAPDPYAMTADPMGRLANAIGILGPTYFWPIDVDLYVRAEDLNSASVTQMVEGLAKEGLRFGHPRDTVGRAWNPVLNRYEPSTWETTIARYDDDPIWAIELWAPALPGDESEVRRVTMLIERGPEWEPLARIRLTTRLYYYLPDSPLTERLLAWIRALARVITPWVGWVDSFRRSPLFTPPDLHTLLARQFPPVRWIMLYGPGYSELIGSDRFAAAPAAQVEELPGGTWLLLTHVHPNERLDHIFTLRDHLYRHHPPVPWQPMKVELFVGSNTLSLDEVQNLLTLLEAQGLTTAQVTGHGVLCWDERTAEHRTVELQEALVVYLISTSWSIRLWPNEEAAHRAFPWGVEFAIERGARAQPYAILTLVALITDGPTPDVPVYLRSWALRLADRLHPFYGWGGRERGASLRRPPTWGRQVANVEPLQAEWLNLLGPTYVERFGREPLLAIPTVEIQERPDGSILIERFDHPSRVDLRKSTLATLLQGPREQWRTQ